MKSEKELDRQYNKIFTDYRRFFDETLCPTCNLPEILKPMLNSQYDEKTKKIVKIEHHHNQEECLRRYLGIILALEKENGRFLSIERIDSIIESAMSKMKALERKFTEGQK